MNNSPNDSTSLNLSAPVPRTRFMQVVDQLRRARTGSYRKVDYWLRTGRISITDAGDGSGSARDLTEAEAEALILWAQEWTSLNEQLDRLRSGERWAELHADAVRRLGS